MGDSSSGAFVPHCPSCGTELVQNAVLCISCGYHLEKGHHLTVSAGYNPQVKIDRDNPYRSPSETTTNRSDMDALTFLASIFWVQGRAPRSEWWMFQAGYFITAVVIGGVADSGVVPELAAIVFVPVYFVAFWLALASQIRRWHDIGKSGFWCLINLVPFGSLYALIELGFEPGTKERNDYGANPLDDAVG